MRYGAFFCTHFCTLCKCLNTLIFCFFEEICDGNVPLMFICMSMVLKLKQRAVIKIRALIITQSIVKDQHFKIKIPMTHAYAFGVHVGDGNSLLCTHLKRLQLTVLDETTMYALYMDGCGWVGGVDDGDRRNASLPVGCADNNSIDWSSADGTGSGKISIYCIRGVKSIYRRTLTRRELKFL